VQKPAWFLVLSGESRVRNCKAICVREIQCIDLMVYCRNPTIELGKECEDRELGK